jgi:hypothetical protein
MPDIEAVEKTVEQPEYYEDKRELEERDVKTDVHTQLCESPRARV